MNKTLQFNCFLDIADPIRQTIIDCSVKYQNNHNSPFVVDGKKYFPHLSLYLFTVPSTNRSKLLPLANKLAKTIKPFKAKIAQVTASENGLVMLEFEKVAELDNAHQIAVSLFNPIRKHTLRLKYNDKNYFASLPKKDQALLNKFGHKYVYQNYHPHISVTLLKDPKVRQEATKELESLFVGKTTETTSLVVTEDDYQTSGTIGVIFDSSLTA